MHYNTEVYDACLAALAGWLEPFPAPWLVQEFNCSPETAKGWKKRKNWPNGPTLMRMILKWGHPFTDAVFAPLYQSRPDDLVDRLRAFEAEIINFRKDAENARDVGVGARLDRVGGTAGEGHSRVATAATPRRVPSRFATGQVAKRAVGTLMVCLAVMGSVSVSDTDRGRVGRVRQPVPVVRVMQSARRVEG